jgi:hypothetical protein
MPRVDFELARELHRSGYPQDSPRRAAMYYDDAGQTVVRFPQLPFPQMGQYRAPSLSALIEACGAHFRALTRDGDTWLANDVPALTPEEAVARLWLAKCGGTDGDRKD